MASNQAGRRIGSVGASGAGQGTRHGNRVAHARQALARCAASKRAVAGSSLPPEELLGFALSVAAGKKTLPRISRRFSSSWLTGLGGRARSFEPPLCGAGCSSRRKKFPCPGVLGKASGDWTSRCCREARQQLETDCLFPRIAPRPAAGSVTRYANRPTGVRFSGVTKKSPHESRGDLGRRPVPKIYPPPATAGARACNSANISLWRC